MHACACVCMVENDEKCSKIIENILFSSCAREAHVKLTYQCEQKLTFLAFRSDSQTLVDRHPKAGCSSEILVKIKHFDT